jgi:tetratricopeptide (TPR) repeat protein
MYELKRLPVESIDRALERADHYRELNQPEEAESICRDILAVAPENLPAKKLLGLALTDRLSEDGAGVAGDVVDEALAIFGAFEAEYDRMYYTGIVHERCAKAELRDGNAHNAASSFESALACFERAEKIAPAGAWEPVLRYNRCVRMLDAHPELATALERARGEQHSVLGD